jgi:hypothetical protein
MNGSVLPSAGSLQTVLAEQQLIFIQYFFRATGIREEPGNVAELTVEDGALRVEAEIGANDLALIDSKATEPGMVKND